MPHRLPPVSALLLALLVPGLSLASAPVAVAPGSPELAAELGSTCPTFHWGFNGSADTYELAIYPAGHGRKTVEPLLVRTLPGTASGWTPSLDQCLEPGREYAWSIRALARGGASEWSEPAFFRIGARTREMELEQALALINEVLAEQRHGAPTAPHHPGWKALSAPAAGLDGTSTQLEVDGDVVGTRFLGDGSGLVNVDADTLDGVDGSGYTASDQACPDGSFISGIDPLGNVVCAAVESVARSDQECPDGLFVFGIDEPGNVRCKRATPISTCLTHQYVAGMDAAGNVICRDFQTYIHQYCKVYFGWRDACPGCLAVPTRWVAASGSETCSGGGEGAFCFNHSLGGVNVRLGHVMLGGQVDDNDRLSVGLVCRQ